MLRSADFYWENLSWKFLVKEKEMLGENVGIDFFWEKNWHAVKSENNHSSNGQKSLYTRGDKS